MYRLCRLSLFSHSKFTIKHNSTINTTQNSSSIDQLITKIKNIQSIQRQRQYRTDYHTVKSVYSHSGAIAELPSWYRLGVLKVLTNIFVFLMIGSMVSKIGTKFLEENDIFKPDDDDEDED